MPKIDPEQGHDLLTLGAQKVHRLGNRSCRYALLTTAAQEGADPLLVLDLGVVQYLAANGQPVQSGRVEPLSTETTRYGVINYTQKTEPLPRPAFNASLHWRPRGELDVYDVYQNLASVGLRSLAVAIQANTHLPVSAAWCDKLDTDDSRMYGSLHLPEGTPPKRMQAMLAFQGHIFDDDGYLRVLAEYDWYRDLPQMMHYTLQPPTGPVGPDQLL